MNAEEKNRKKHEKHLAKKRDDERDENENDGDDDDDDMRRSHGGEAMSDELRKAHRELRDTLGEDEDEGGRAGKKDDARPSLKAIINQTAENLQRSAAALLGLGTQLSKSDAGNDPDYQSRQEKDLARRKRGKSDNDSDNESYEEQESRQAETIEDAEDDADGSTIISGAGKRNADFHAEGGGRRISLPDHEGGIDKSQRGNQHQEEFYRSLADNEQFVQVLEASPALEHLTDVMAERYAELATMIDNRLNALSKSFALIMNAQAKMMKSAVNVDSAGRPISAGILGRTDGNGPVTHYDVRGGNPADKGNNTAGQPLRKSLIAERIQAAVDDGKADIKELSQFDAGGLDAVSIDEETRKVYGIPLSPAVALH